MSLLFQTLLNEFELALFLIWNNGRTICCGVVSDEDVYAFSQQKEEENNKKMLSDLNIINL